MITSVKIKNVATFDKNSGEISDLKKLNFFYGANGSGKTTISRVLANPSSYCESEILWKNNEVEDVIVYNHDFVKRNFSSSSKIPGIYTMGESSIEIENKIVQLRNDWNEKQEEKRKALNGITEDGIKEYFQGKKNENRSFYEDDFWKLKENVKETELDGFLSGFKGSKSKLFDKLIDEYHNNKSPKWTKDKLITHLKLKKKAKVSRLQKIKLISVTGLQITESDPLFKEVIIGKSNSTIGELIEKVGNGQWVLNGKKYLEKSEGKCPFCQQKLPEEFSKILEDYFDHTYTEKIETLKQLKENYEKEVNGFLEQIKNWMSASEKEYQYLDKSKLKDINTSAECLLKSNLNAIYEKINIPSNVVNLHSSFELTNSVNKLVGQL